MKDEECEALASDLKNIFYNRGPAPLGNDAATCTQALFEALRLFTKCNHRPIPKWIGLELLEAYDRFQDGREPSLEAALGMTRPRKAEREARRVDSMTGLSVAARIVLEINGRHQHYKQAIDTGLFESVGKALPAPLAESKVKRIYYDKRQDSEVLAEISAYLDKATNNPEWLAEAKKFPRLPVRPGKA